jgi:type I restriction enzyme M protein
MLVEPIRSQILQSRKSHQSTKSQNQSKIAKAAAKVLAEMFLTGREEAHHSRLVDMDEIAENDWNLNVPRYVDTNEPEGPIDVSETLQELDRLVEERRKIDAKLQVYMSELDYR